MPSSWPETPFSRVIDGNTYRITPEAPKSLQWALVFLDRDGLKVTVVALQSPGDTDAEIVKMLQDMKRARLRTPRRTTP